jgi:hypothetical protein
MSSSNVGRLQRVALREVWKHEAQDFTQWLQNNIDVLNESLDLNLVGANRERSAGDFSVDLVAEDEGGGTIIIENQLEKSNHDHLGKLITYLTAIGAKTFTHRLKRKSWPKETSSTSCRSRPIRLKWRWGFANLPNG